MAERAAVFQSYYYFYCLSYQQLTHWVLSVPHTILKHLWAWSPLILTSLSSRFYNYLLFFFLDKETETEVTQDAQCLTISKEWNLASQADLCVWFSNLFTIVCFSMVFTISSTPLWFSICYFDLPLSSSSLFYYKVLLLPTLMPALIWGTLSGTLTKLCPVRYSHGWGFTASQPSN